MEHRRGNRIQRVAVGALVVAALGAIGLAGAVGSQVGRISGPTSAIGSIEPAPRAVDEPPSPSPPSSSGDCPSGPGYRGCRVGVVVRVVDGDTIQLDSGPKIRFLGMDTPERNECGYEEATQRVRELAEGRTVTVVHAEGNEFDKYRRELGYIEIEGVDLGRLLIVEGYAHARYDALDGFPRHPRQDDYRAVDSGTTNRCGTTPRSAPPPTTASTTAPTTAPPSMMPLLPGVPTTTASSGCHPAYSPCLPVGPDLDCADIGVRVRVIGTEGDPYRLDADRNGIGCEAYPDPPG